MKHLRTVSILIVLVSVAILLWMVMAFESASSTPNLPKPTGEYTVGTTEMYFADGSRIDYSGKPGIKREIMVKIWYPADPEPGAKVAPYWQDDSIIRNYYKKLLNGNSYFYDKLSSIKTNSFLNTRISVKQSSYPVLIFSHGYKMLFTDNSAQMEELASHGYIVVSIAHTYDSPIVVFPHRRVVTFNIERDQKANQEGLLCESEFKEKWLANSSPDERKNIAKKEFEVLKIMLENVKVRTDDIRFVASELEKLNAGKTRSIFKGRMDLLHMGVFGMSLGGAAAIEACKEDTRIKVGINMDGFAYSNMPDTPIKQPFMTLYSKDGIKTENDFMYDLFKDQSYTVSVNGSKHMDFTDYCIIKKGFKQMNVFGTIDSARMNEITNKSIVGFFDKYLKKSEVDLKNLMSSYSQEVVFKDITKSN